MSDSFKFGLIYRPPSPNVARLRRFGLMDAPTPPATYDVNVRVKELVGISIAPQMDANDQHNCCVMAAQAKYLRRYHALETSALINVTPAQVVAAYMGQTGGDDNGLVPHDSLATWTTSGWAAGDDGAVHKIVASARVDATDEVELQRCIWKLGGCLMGGPVPGVWRFQTSPWEPMPNSTIAGGHMMWAYAYDADGVWVETWGREQLITWDCVKWFCAESNGGEAYGLVRGVDSVTPADGFDVPALQAALAECEEK